jgi:tetratricopeptide (TPR) repeat protein
MMMPAILLVAILGSPQAPPPAAPPAKAAPPKAARKAPRKKAAPKPAEPAAAEPAADTAAAPAGSASDAIQAGLAAFAKRRFSEARSDFERAVAADPQSAAAHFYLGYTIYKIAEPKKHDSPGKHEAAEHFAKAYELDPNFKPVWGSHKG